MSLMGWVGEWQVREERGSDKKWRGFLFYLREK